jgi:hypothetical protein
LQLAAGFIDRALGEGQGPGGLLPDDEQEIGSN